MRGCPHQREASDVESEFDPEDAATEATVHLGRLRHLLASASALLAEAEQVQEIDRLVTDATTPPREPTEADEVQLRALEDEAAKIRSKGLAIGIAAGVVPWPPEDGYVEVLSIAEGENILIKTLIAQAEGAEDNAALEDDAAWLHERLVELQRRI
jgi:hypothetical protein